MHRWWKERERGRERGGSWARGQVCSSCSLRADSFRTSSSAVGGGFGPLSGGRGDPARAPTTVLSGDVGPWGEEGVSSSPPFRLRPILTETVISRILVCMHYFLSSAICVVSADVSTVLPDFLSAGIFFSRLCPLCICLLHFLPRSDRPRFGQIGHVLHLVWSD